MNELTIVDNNQIGVTAFKHTQPNNVTFHRDGKVIGIFNFDVNPMTFEGDVDESARLFCDTVLGYMPQLIEKYKN